MGMWVVNKNIRPSVKIETRSVIFYERYQSVGSKTEIKPSQNLYLKGKRRKTESLTLHM